MSYFVIMFCYATNGPIIFILFYILLCENIWN